MAPGKDAWERLADSVSRQAGRSWTFQALLWGSLAWFCLGPILRWAEWWYEGYQVVTQWLNFLMLFAIQNATNRSGKAAQLKLDELIKSCTRADDRLVQVDEAGEDEIDRERAARKTREERPT